jgi:outer membrane lipoprotein
MKKLPIMIVPLLLLVGGCAHNLSEGSLALADRTITFGKLRENPDAYHGKFVMLGGVIKAISHTPQGTRLEVEQYGLDSREMPDQASGSGERFLAMAPEKLSESVCGTGLLVSMAGEVVGKKVLFREGEEYIYPVIAIKELRIVRTPDEDFFRTWVPYGP